MRCHGNGVMTGLTAGLTLSRFLCVSSQVLFPKLQHLGPRVTQKQQQTPSHLGPHLFLYWQLLRLLLLWHFLAFESTRIPGWHTTKDEESPWFIFWLPTLRLMSVKNYGLTPCRLQIGHSPETGKLLNVMSFPTFLSELVTPWQNVENICENAVLSSLGCLRKLVLKVGKWAKPPVYPTRK